MAAEQTNRISVIDPISPAVERVKIMLFKPFDLGRWFVIGFCAWLAHLGTGGGGGGGGPHNIPQKEGELQEHISEGTNTAKEFIMYNLDWIIPTAAIVIAALIVLGLVITWINSRGKFMFLHCVATNKSEVKVPWHKFRKHGNSLFLFRLILGVIGFVVVAVPVISIILFVVAMTAGAAPTIVSVLGIAVFGMVVFILSMVLFLVMKFTFDFVVPIMFLRTESCSAAWHELMAILSVNKVNFVLYLLFQIVISIAIDVIIMTGACIGCCLCCASALLYIPYIGTVILLPLLAFKRAYSLYYLRQFGPEFDVFIAQHE